MKNIVVSSIDSSPYQGSCPCPIQSFPKNVHIGPLIGSSKTDKGPCQKNSSHLHESALNPNQFKTENPTKKGDLELDVKPEIVNTLTQYDTIDGSRNHKDINSIDRTFEKIALVPQHHPNYTLNPKLMEQPEMSISPARGSIGPGIPKIQAGATQPVDTLDKSVSASLMNLQNQTPATGRRARVGKNMAREMMLQSHPTVNDLTHEMEIDLQGDSLHESKVNICSSTPIKEQIHNEEYDKNHTNTPHFMTATKPINGKMMIKKEHVKKEFDDDVLVISEKSDSDTNLSDLEKSNSIQIIDLSSDSGKNQTNDKSNQLKRYYDSSSDEIIDLDEDNSIATVKRRKILEFQKNPNKKSPPNSYKNLIKPSDPKSYLRRSDSSSKETSPTGKCSMPISIDGTNTILINGSSEHDSLSNASCDMDMDISDFSAVDSSEHRTESIGKTVNTISLSMPSIADEFPQELSAEEENLMSHLDSHMEGIAKGYCSDNEILSRKKERLKLKLQKSEGRSRSESKKSDKVTSGKSTPKSGKSKSKSRKTSRDRSTSSSKSKERIEKQPSKKLKLSSENTTTTTTDKKKNDQKAKKSKTSKAKKSCEKPTQENHEKTSDTDDALLDNESHINNNNNNILLDKNNKLHLEALAASTFNANKSLSAKKSKSRGCKFSNKKKHRARHAKHIEEVIIPRQTSAAPRWSNGWTWQGEPFQGKVFLNVSIKKVEN